MLATWVTAAIALIAAIVSYMNHRRIAEVHVLVNNQLDAVMTKLNERTAERDILQKEKDDQ